jgi:hypothetical protein
VNHHFYYFQANANILRGWGGGYFIAHGDSTSPEEWKEEKDVAINSGPFEAE